jgi:transposase
MIILRTKMYKQESNIEGLIIVLRLALMMFLQYMMFAVWWVPLAAYTH